VLEEFRHASGHEAGVNGAGLSHAQMRA
jgi:hypothetical protein